MKNWKAYIQAGAWSALVLLLIPPLWYSLRTPFALIDDYGNWAILRSFNHMSGIILWFQDTWFHPQNRFRITFDMYQLLTWRLLGDNSALHHGMRWVLKAVVVWATFNILRLMASTRHRPIGLSFWVFCALYIFFPNNPEARLAPVELLTVTFLAILLYEICHLCMRARGDLTALSLRRYLWVLFVFTFMLWSKEPNIVMGMVTFALLACLNLRSWKRLFPFIVILLITGLRVHAESKAGGYGTAPINGDLIYHNIAFHGRSLLLAKVSLVGALLLSMGWLMVQTWKTGWRKNSGLRGMVSWLQTHLDLTYYWLVCLNMLVCSATFLISWHLVLRYFYPLVYLLALWIGLTLLAVESFSFRWRLAVTGLAIVASVYFIGVNYYNFVYQFANQYYTARVEQDVLRNVDQLLKDGKTVSLTPASEYEISIEDYFNDYLLYYKQTGYRITTTPMTVPCNNCYYVSYTEKPLTAGQQWCRHFDYSHVSGILWWSDRVSSWLSFGHPALYWRDLGADWIGRHGEKIPGWYIYSCRDTGACPWLKEGL